MGPAFPQLRESMGGPIRRCMYGLAGRAGKECWQGVLEGTGEIIIMCKQRAWIRCMYKRRARAADNAEPAEWVGGYPGLGPS